MDREKANIMRLRVNRLNLVQKIEPSEVLPKLVKYKVVERIEAESASSGRTREDRARNLIDLLITKEHFQKDWYNHFRNILQDCNYKELVVFLDNTIIKPPNFVSRFANKDIYNEKSRKSNETSVNQDDNVRLETIESLNSANNFKSNTSKNTSEKVTGISFDEDKLNSVMMKGSYEKTILNLQTFSLRPEAVIAELSKYDDLDDLKQIDLENSSFIWARKLELLYSLYQSEEPLKNSFFLDNEVVSTIISSQSNFIYMKYFKNLKDSFGIDMLKYFKNSLFEYIKSGPTNLKFYDNLDDLVKNLSLFLVKNEENDLANHILTSYLNYVSSVQENSVSTDTHFKSAFEIQSLLLLVKNNLMDFKNAYEIYTILSKLYIQIKSLSIESQINCSQMYYGISQTTLEEGSFDAAYDWINKSLLALDYNNDLVIDILGHATLCYSSKWYLTKAKTIASLSIQIARSKYGKNHPAFIKSLLYYGYFSNEFIQDASTINLAKYTLNLAKRVFGFDSLMVGEAHKSYAKALMACKQFGNDLYLEHAHDAFKIASAFFNLDNPKLMSYQTTLALALQWKGVQNKDQRERHVYLQDSLDLCTRVMNNSKNLFGEINSRTAQIYLLMGSIYLYMEKLNEAEKYHIKSLEILQVVLSPKNYHVLFGKSTLGVFYKVIGRIRDAYPLFQDVVDNLEFDYDKMIPWIPTVFEYLVDCYRIMQLNDQANIHQNTLEKLRESIAHKKNSNDFVLEMEKEPPSDLHHFFVSNFMQK